MKCKCGAELHYDGKGEMTTLVGFSNGECGNPHDNNCRSRGYFCKNGHVTYVYKQPSCPCGWKGKLTCFCHEGEKVVE